MGLGAVRKGDWNMGHGPYMPTKANSCSGNVRINGKGAVRKGDAFKEHKLGKKKHTDFPVTGSATVRINGKPAARKLDAISDPTRLKCSSIIITASRNVKVGP